MDLIIIIFIVAIIAVFSFLVYFLIKPSKNDAEKKEQVESDSGSIDLASTPESKSSGSSLGQTEKEIGAQNGSEKVSPEQDAQEASIKDKFAEVQSAGSKVEESEIREMPESSSDESAREFVSKESVQKPITPEEPTPKPFTAEEAPEEAPEEESAEDDIRTKTKP